MSGFCVGIKGVLPHGGVHVSPLYIYITHYFLSKIINTLLNINILRHLTNRGKYIFLPIKE
ncbi:transmembrane protein, putative [Medicago truncatula]|uniref:Transmembrane protein, putative n=1 Tax=Medicago truncatula TaxID=3880 RepID=G8A0M0_MEDTR|nr:transmembrane protein, putative [Medicago truncatula]